MSALHHILAADPGEPSPVPIHTPPTHLSPQATSSVPLAATNPSNLYPRAILGANDEHMAETPNRKSDDGVGEPAPASSKRNTNSNGGGLSLGVGTNVSSVYSGNKIKHLKKEDGIPLWRKDIQYDFLCHVFYDKTPCFTKYSDDTKGHTFAEVYVDAMAKSSKTSKILKEKLLQDQEGAISMAMVCLLVNVGRMNTTLNFFPEMRAQLRTYHSIPALQAQQDPNSYKQLQDAPRLKSILKGATEDEPQPGTLEEIRAAKMPRTNPVNLIFVMSQYAPKITESHFQAPRDFFDIVMRSTLSSASRAKAFLWLIWWYLESDFSYEDTQRNPFGRGQFAEGEESSGVLPLKVPTLESLTEEQAALENVDTETELHFGESKRKERIAILASEPSPAMTALKRARKEKILGHLGLHGSDDERSEVGAWKTSESRLSGRAFETGSDYTRSPSPASRSFHAGNSALKASDVRIHDLLNADDNGVDGSPTHTPTTTTKKGPGRGNWRRNKSKLEGGRASEGHHVPLLPNTGLLSFVNEAPAISTSFSAALGRDHVPTPSYQAQKRFRGMTQHQSAVNLHRRMQIDYLLDRRIRDLHAEARIWRRREGTIVRAWKRIRLMPVDYDSEDEDGASGRKSSRESVADQMDDWRPLEHDGLDLLDGFQNSRAFMAGVVRTRGDVDDVGEEYKARAKAFGRALRRLDRWADIMTPGQAIQQRRENASKPRPRPRENRETEGGVRKAEYTPVLGKSRVAKPKRAVLKGKGAAKVKTAATRVAKKGGTVRKARPSQAATEQDVEPPPEVEEEYEEEPTTVVDMDDDDREMLGDGDGEESDVEDADEEMVDE